MTNTYYMKSGTSFMVTTKESMDLHKKLPAGTYTVKQNPMTGAYYLEAIENFELPSKMYGTTERTSSRILNTFKDRPNSTGVMLSGEKGSGKTLLAKKLSLEGIAEGIPTIVINQPHHGEAFNGFMQMIEQPTVIIFDEFEKVYEREQQEKMLTLLDGVYPSKKLFVITCNDKWRVNEHMRNRPGRIFYRIEYAGLDSEFITEYCEDNLKDKTQIDSLVRVGLMFSEFNFDMLKAIVEDMNRYDETAQEVMKMLNAKPEHGDNADYKATLSVGGKNVSADDLEEDSDWRGNPLASDIRLSYLTGTKDADDDANWAVAAFSPRDLKTIDKTTGKFHFVNPKGEKLALTKVKAETFNWSMV